MSGAAALAPRHSRVREWLRYDQSRVADVEEAYREFVRTARMGPHLAGGLAAALAAIVLIAAAHAGKPVASYAGWASVIAGLVFYAVPAVGVARVDRRVLRTMLCGAVDLRRACAAGFLLGLAGAFVETTLIALLAAAHTRHPAPVNFFGAGLLAGMLMLGVAAPVVEEFAMQGWLQTRALRFGPVPAGVLTTIVFIAAHVPRTLMELARGVTLGLAAWLRGTTRSLGACIVVHATNNIFFGAILAAVLLSHHHIHR